MSWVRWNAVWHAVLDEDTSTLCGRRIPWAESTKRINPPGEVFLCSICRKLA